MLRDGARYDQRRAAAREQEDSAAKAALERGTKVNQPRASERILREMEWNGECNVPMYQCTNVPMYQVNRASERILREMEGRDGASHASERLLQARVTGCHGLSRVVTSRDIVTCCFPPRPPARPPARPVAASWLTVARWWFHRGGGEQAAASRRKSAHSGAVVVPPGGGASRQQPAGVKV